MYASLYFGPVSALTARWCRPSIGEYLAASFLGFHAELGLLGEGIKRVIQAAVVVALGACDSPWDSRILIAGPAESPNLVDSSIQARKKRASNGGSFVWLGSPLNEGGFWFGKNGEGLSLGDSKLTEPPNHRAQIEQPGLQLNI